MQNLLAGQLRQKAAITSEGELVEILAELRSSTRMKGLSSGARRLLQALPDVVTDFEGEHVSSGRDVDSRQRTLDSLRVASNRLLQSAGLSIVEDGNADFELLSSRLAELARQQESAQIKLSASEQRLVRALNATESVAWDWDLTVDKLTVISASEDVLGIPRDQIEKNTPRIADFMPPGEVEHFHHKLIEHLRGASPEFKFGVWLTDRKHKNAYMYFHGKVVERNAQGRALRMAGIMHDLTANRQAEEAVGVSEARFRSLTELSSDWYWEQDDQFRYTDTHGESEARGGISATEHLHRTRWELPYTHPVGFGWNAHRETLQRRESFRDLMLKREVPGSTPRYISVSGAPIFNDSGAFTGYRGIARDVTGRIQAEEALRQAQLAAEEASRTKSQFLANMSHEIRTPMNGVLGMTELLLGTGLNSKQRHFVETARRSGEVLLRLLNDILDFSKIEAGKLEIDRVDFELQEIVADVVALLAESAAIKGLRLESRIMPAVPKWVTGDPNRLRQILTNLVGNAIKFTHRGEVIAEVAVVAASDGARLLQFEVRDTGIGIAQEAQGHVFNAFSQGDEYTIRRYGGTGLGLSISRELVTLMGGAITLQSELGQGSTFRFTLPCDEASPHAESDPKTLSMPMMSVSRADSASLPHFSGHILVAEDNPVNQEVIRAVLEANGCKVHVSNNGREALEAMQRMSFDLIFMDCQMPEMDGYTATRAIRALEQNGLVGARRVPIVALTAHATQADRERCFAADMDSFLSKPFTQAVLRRELQRWLKSDTVEVTDEAVALPITDSGSLDVQTLNELRLMDPTGELGLMQELVSTYLEHTTPLIAALRAAIETGDRAKTESSAHKIRSGSLTMGAIGVARISGEIENSSRAIALTACLPLMSAMEVEYAKAQKSLLAEIHSPS